MSDTALHAACVRNPISRQQNLGCRLFLTTQQLCVCVGGGDDRGIFQINVWTLILKASVNYGNCSPGYSDSGQDCDRNPQKINHTHCRCADWLGGKSIGRAGSCVCVCSRDTICVYEKNCSIKGRRLRCVHDYVLIKCHTSVTWAYHQSRQAAYTGRTGFRTACLNNAFA